MIKVSLLLVQYFKEVALTTLLSNHVPPFWNKLPYDIFAAKTLPVFKDCLFSLCNKQCNKVGFKDIEKQSKQ